jgi:uncharacterized membrane protein YqhA
VGERTLLAPEMLHFVQHDTTAARRSSVTSPRSPESTMPPLLTLSRYLVVLAITGCVLGAAALFAYGLAAVVRVVWSTVAADIAVFGQPDTDVVAIAEHLAVALIQLADVFLLGTVIYLVGLGLHLLFINPKLPSEPWLAIGDLDDLKEMLVRVIVLLVGVTFLGSFVEHADDVEVLELSIASAIIVIAFSLVILVAKLPNWQRERAEETRSGPPPPTEGG